MSMLITRKRNPIAETPAPGRWSGFAPKGIGRILLTVGVLSGLISGKTAFAQDSAAGEAGVSERSSAIVQQFINERIRQAWEDNEVEPSPTADDAEWLRRVYLDIVGHIPSAEEVEAFLDDKSDTKRQAIVEKLLNHPDYVRNMTEVWTNLGVN